MTRRRTRRLPKGQGRVEGGQGTFPAAGRFARLIFRVIKLYAASGNPASALGTGSAATVAAAADTSTRV
jgi:hypothetical protein